MCRRILVSGRVQGVGYRAFTRREAARLGLPVRATNLPDGTVEVIACGDERTLAALSQRLREGPAWSEVQSLREEAADCLSA